MIGVDPGPDQPGLDPAQPAIASASALTCDIGPICRSAGAGAAAAVIASTAAW